jgi:hypothetical protein
MKKAVVLLVAVLLVVGIASTVSAAPADGTITYVLKDPGGGVRP